MKNLLLIRRRLLVAIPTHYTQNSAIIPGFRTAMVFFRHPLLHK
jgi:hypothetical protein